jgi:hypothetical protein
MIQMAEDLGQQVGVKRACEVLAVPRSRLYQARHPPRHQHHVPNRPGP